MKSLLSALALSVSVAMPAWASPEWVKAKVVKLEPERSRVVLNHEKIKSLPMEAMTMPFKVESAKLLDGLKVGQQVKFTFIEKDGHLTINAIERAR